MKFIPSLELPYTDKEKAKLAVLEQLFIDWSKTIETRIDEIKGDKVEGVKYKIDDLVFDGFYPFYFDQKIRVLYIGRESRCISGDNYIDSLYKAYTKTRKIGCTPLHMSAFHRRQLIIINAINNYRFNNLKEICDAFGGKDGLSFAFMNLSKFSNEIKWQSEYNIINSFFEISTNSRNFIKEQIEILDPHVIISMNFGELLNKLGFGVKYNEYTKIYGSEYGNAYSLKINGRKSLLINTGHFSAPRQNDDRYIHSVLTGISGAKNMNLIEW